MNKLKTKFHSKILLFGEYALMFGSDALSIPYTELYGYFSFEKSEKPNSGFDSNAHLRKYADFLGKQLKQVNFETRFSFDQLEKDIANGLIFNSNIPLGYGLGSSGALVAALYSRYAKDAINPSRNLSNGQLEKLKTLFAQMESYFHGKSSGLDPLICYLQRPILLQNGSCIKIIEPHKKKPSTQNTLFLLDTGTTGETQPLVNYFTKKCRSSEFLNQLKAELIPANQQAIEAFLQNNSNNLFPHLKKISTFTQKYLKPMIPDSIRTVWQKGLDTDHFYLKLCGSGGGGMMLGFTTDFEYVKTEIKKFPLHIVQRF